MFIYYQTVVIQYISCLITHISKFFILSIKHNKCNNYVTILGHIASQLKFEQFNDLNVCSCKDSHCKWNITIGGYVTSMWEFTDYLNYRYYQGRRWSLTKDFKVNPVAKTYIIDMFYEPSSNPMECTLSKRGKQLFLGLKHEPLKLNSW